MFAVKFFSNLKNNNMKKLKDLQLNAKELNREQMKNVLGGGGPIGLPKCFKCCPDDKCSSRPHVCPANNCGPAY